MENQRTTRVRLDRMDRRQLLLVQGLNVLMIVIALIIAAVGPDMLTEKQPASDSGTGVRLANVTKSRPRNYCYFDSPTPVDPVDIRYCWSHRFRFHNVFSDFFKLDMAANRKPGYLDQTNIERDLHLRLSWWGQVDRDDEGSWEEIATKVVEREVSCPEKNTQCDRDILFQASHIVYETYWFMVNIPNETSYVDAASFIESVDFFFIYENRAFAQYELGFKYAFCVMAMISLAYWHRACRRATGGKACTLWPYKSFEQHWIAALNIATIWFDYPLYALVYSDHDDVRRFGGVVGVMCEFTCATLFLLFWLCLFDALVKREHQLGFWSFYLPKLAFCTLFWACGVGAYAWVVLQGNNDPLYNWYEDRDHFVYIRVYAGVFAGIYLLWVVWLLCQASYELQAMSRAAQLMYFGHVWRCFALLGGMVFGAVYMLEVDNANDLLFFHTLLNFYVVELVALYSPVPEGRRHSFRMNDELAERHDDNQYDGEMAPIEPGPGSVEMVGSLRMPGAGSRSAVAMGADEKFDPNADALNGQDDHGAGTNLSQITLS